jgi:hypothetical protein
MPATRLDGPSSCSRMLDRTAGVGMATSERMDQPRCCIQGSSFPVVRPLGVSSSSRRCGSIPACSGPGRVAEGGRHSGAARPSHCHRGHLLGRTLNHGMCALCCSVRPRRAPCSTAAMSRPRVLPSPGGVADLSGSAATSRSRRAVAPSATARPQLSARGWADV